MGNECTHDCSSCSASCPSRDKQSLLEPQNSSSNIKHVIGVVSGKGGVGKSLVTSMLAVTMARRGFNTAILDADITGPSIPKAFGLKTGCVEGSELGMFPPKTKTGIEVMSLNLLVDEETKPVVWRGPVIAGTVKQFWTDVVWNDVDYMFVDMPPGTGDVPLTVFQSLPIDGIIVVSSPQDLVSLIVEKAMKMASLMNIKVLGLVENYSFFKCPCCGEETKIYGESNIDALAKEYGVDVLAKLPIDSSLAKLCDKGIIELMENSYMDLAADKIEEMTK
ncbi:MAG: Mrp/NBP35 family ATP-binding protein [Ruminococcaceae bacterium]|nr:Mrp/NBP35 family ATP-binding protein [Oscillospiraceae bacterium]